MSEDERLREALIEVQSLRESQALALSQTQTLLAIFESVAIAPDPATALASFLEQICTGIGAEFVDIVAIDDGQCMPVQSWPPDVMATSFAPPVSLGEKNRRYPDLHQIPGWADGGDPIRAQQRSLLSAPFTHADGNPGALLCFHRDPGRFGLAQANLVRQLGGFAAQLLNTLHVSQQNALLAAVIDGSSTGFAISDAQDPDLPLVFVNPAFEQITGYGAPEIIGQNCRFLSAEPAHSPERTRLRQAVIDRQPGQFLLQNKRKDSSLFWNDLSLFPVYDDAHRVTHLVATQTDASDKVRNAQERQTAQQRLEAILSHTNDAFVLVLTDGTIGFANAAHEQMFPARGPNWRAGSSFAQNWQAYLDGLPKAQRPRTGLLLDFDPLDLDHAGDGLRLDLPDGKHVILRAAHTEDSAVVLSTTDITALQNTERLLQQRAAAIESTSEGIGIADAKGRIVYANPSLARMFAVGHENRLIGRKWRGFYTQDKNDPHLDKLSALDASNLRVLKRHDDQNRYHETVASMVDGVGEVFVVRNVTNRVAMQERQMQLDHQIEASTRRDVVSKLAAGVAHDLNNLLSVVSASSTMLNLQGPLTDEAQKHVGRISQATAQASLLANRLLDVASPTDTDSLFDLRSIITSVQDLVTPNLGAQITLTMSLPDAPILVTGQPTDASQVLVNLILNANDACHRADGEIHVRLRAGPAPDASTLVLGDVAQDRAYALIEVIDNGSGIDPNVRERIFEPYFSTKGHQGTGIGLPMVATIVERLGGAIDIQSAPGSGSNFTVYWPLQSETPVKAPDANEHHDLNGLTFLVVDDDPNVSEVAAQYLETLGAEATAISDPELALDALLDDPSGWSALITDYEMPNLSGGDLVEKLRAAHCPVPVYMATGLAKRLADPRINETSVQAVFAKPLDLRQLGAKLASDFGSADRNAPE